MGGIQPARLSTVIDNDTRNARRGFTDELPQASARATDKKGCTCQFRDSLRQADFFHERESGTRLDLPAQTDRYISCRSFTGFDFRQVMSGFPHHFQQILQFRKGFLQHCSSLSVNGNTLPPNAHSVLAHKLQEKTLDGLPGALLPVKPGESNQWLALRYCQWLSPPPDLLPPYDLWHPRQTDSIGGSWSHLQ